MLPSLGRLRLVPAIVGLGTIRGAQPDAGNIL